ncbi:MAG: hypothetical protein ACE5EU_08760, partial [Paracoccaceae bacterium]
PDHSRWTASGEADGSRIVATANRRGEILELVFHVDHRDTTMFHRTGSRYTQTCTVLVSDPVFECWLSGSPNRRPGAKVVGTFPRLTYGMWEIGHANNTVPGNIVLDFRPQSKTGAREIAAPTIPTPETQSQRARPEPEVAVASSSTQDGIPDDGRWTASGEASNGSRILATATRRGDTLRMVFELDHRNAASSTLSGTDRYTQSCTVAVSDAAIECWIPGLGVVWPGAKVFGAFPRLAYRMVWHNGYPNPTPRGDIVLEFHSERRLARE